MLKDDVLTLLLASGALPISGEGMCQQLGVSRAAVWKCVEQLRKEGYEISSAPNRGYRLEHCPDRLSAQVISANLGAQVVGNQIVCLDATDSTNEEIKRQASTGVREGLAVLSALQTGGKGRRGRSFSSPEGGLYLSVLLRPDCSVGELFQITAWVAVAVCRGIFNATGLDVGIKWTNDLVVEGKKLGGILTELGMEGESGAINYVAVGVGLNLTQGAEDFPPEIRDVATSLAQHMERVPQRNLLAGALLKSLDEMYVQFPTARQDYLEAYRKNCLTIGQHCQIHRHSGEISPVFAENIDQDFGLIVRHPDGKTETVTAGEVSVRGLCGYAK